MKMASLCALMLGSMPILNSCSQGGTTSTSSSSVDCEFPFVADSTRKSCVCAAGTQFGTLCVNDTAGATWQVIPSPGSVNQNSYYDLYSGWSSSRDNVWVSGLEYTGSAGCPSCPNEMRSVLLHWDGVAWADSMHDLLPNQPYRFWAFGGNDVWVQTSIAPTGVAPTDSASSPALFHWDGTKWNGPDAPVFSLAGGADYISFAIIPGSPGPNDLWARIGDRDETSVSHWDGYAWTAKLVSRGTISALGPNNIWEANGAILRQFDGVNWTTAATIPDEAAPDVQVSAIFGFSTKDVWVGQDNLYKYPGAQTRVLRHFDGTTWTTFDFGFPDNDSYHLSSLWGTAPDNLWAAGAGRYYGGGNNEQGFILHWDGTTWSQTATFSGVPAFIWGEGDDLWVSVNHWYTLGKTATVLHRSLN